MSVRWHRDQEYFKAAPLISRVKSNNHASKVENTDRIYQRKQVNTQIPYQHPHKKSNLEKKKTNHALTLILF